MCRSRCDKGQRPRTMTRVPVPGAARCHVALNDGKSSRRAVMLKARELRYDVMSFQSRAMSGIPVHHLLAQPRPPRTALFQGFAGLRSTHGSTKSLGGLVASHLRRRPLGRRVRPHQQRPAVPFQLLGGESRGIRRLALTQPRLSIRRAPGRPPLRGRRASPAAWQRRDSMGFNAAIGTRTQFIDRTEPTAASAEGDVRERPLVVMRGIATGNIRLQLDRHPRAHESYTRVEGGLGSHRF